MEEKKDTNNTTTWTMTGVDDSKENRLDGCSLLICVGNKVFKLCDVL